MSQAMVDPVCVVSFASGDRVSGSTSSGSLPAGSTIAFSSIEELDKALMLAGDSQSYLDSLTINDKVFRLRSFVDDGTLASTDFIPSADTDTSDPTNEVRDFGAVWINTATPEVFQTDGDGNWVSVWSGV